MAETDNWKDQLQPKIADEAEFIVNAFCDPATVSLSPE